MPTRPPSSPRQITPIAFGSEPEASTTAPIRPGTISEKYSAGPNLKATAASGTANAASNRMPTQPAKKEPSAARWENNSFMGKSSSTRDGGPDRE
jgi:hypothetical protein